MNCSDNFGGFGFEWFLSEDTNAKIWVFIGGCSCSRKSSPTTDFETHYFGGYITSLALTAVFTITGLCQGLQIRRDTVVVLGRYS